MKHTYLTNTPLEQARELYLNELENAGMSYKVQTLATHLALGRVTACAVRARRCSPHYCACAMDGIALKAGVTFGAGEATPVTLRKSEYIPVDTGDPLPAGCDCVVMAEEVVDAQDGSVMLYSAAVPWQHVRQIGEDVSLGDMIAPSFTRITPALIGAFLAGGVNELEVVSEPCVAIIPTGDEIVGRDSEPDDGQIPEFNSAIFNAMLCEWGAKGRVYPVVRDDPELISGAIELAARECDAVIDIAGSSAGRDDYTKLCVERLGTVVLHGIAVKPGKPAVLGRIGSVPVVGVPGYPVSGIIIMEQIMAYVTAKLTCIPPREPEYIQAYASRRITSSLKYREYVRCRLSFAADKPVCIPMDRGAGVVSGFARASGLAEIPLNSEGAEAGQPVKVSLLGQKSELERSVCVLGSHDPLIDEIADILKRSGCGYSVISGHLGSMGGLLALKRGEARLCPTHLLDEQTGKYNESYISRLFPQGGVTLIKGVRRVQGIITAAGNPYGIKQFKDIAEKELSFVNRQRGSGTRVLLDYLLKESCTDSSCINGYEREEYTHTAVAASIANGSACAGMGIYSAAKLYNLDFIPLWDEQYDIAAADCGLEDEGVRLFLDALKSGELKKRLEQMGGYAFWD